MLGKNFFEISIFGEFRTKLPYLGIWLKISCFEIFRLKYDCMDLFECSLEKNLILHTITIKATYIYQNVSVGMTTVAPFTLYCFHTKTV